MAPGICKSISDHRFKSSWNASFVGSVRIVEAGDTTCSSEASLAVIDIATKASIIIRNLATYSKIIDVVTERS